MRTSADSLKNGWDKVIETLIEKDQLDKIEPETLSAYEEYTGVIVTQPADVARATL